MKKCTAQQIIIKMNLKDKGRCISTTNDKEKQKNQQKIRFLIKQNSNCSKISSQIMNLQIIEKKFSHKNKKALNKFKIFLFMNEISSKRPQLISRHIKNQSLQSQKYEQSYSLKKLQFPIKINLKNSNQKFKTKRRKSCFQSICTQIPTKKNINYHKKSQKQPSNRYLNKLEDNQKKTQRKRQNKVKSQLELRKDSLTKYRQRNLSNIIKNQKYEVQQDKKSIKLVQNKKIYQNSNQITSNKLQINQFDNINNKQNTQTQTKNEKKPNNNDKICIKSAKKIQALKFIINPFEKIKFKNKINFKNQISFYKQNLLNQPPENKINPFDNNEISIIQLRNDFGQIIKDFLSDQQLFKQEIFDI